MERATVVLNKASAVIVLATGVYVQLAFSHMLTLVARVMIGAVAMAYALMRLVPKTERTETRTTEQTS